MTASRLREAAGSVRYPVERGRARPLAVGKPASEGASRPRLLDRLRGALRARHYSRRTEDAYVAWIRRYIIFHGKRHPVGMSVKADLVAYLEAVRAQHAEDLAAGAGWVELPTALMRSEERRVGKECRSRWSPYH